MSPNTKDDGRKRTFDMVLVLRHTESCHPGLHFVLVPFGDASTKLRVRHGAVMVQVQETPSVPDGGHHFATCGCVNFPRSVATNEPGLWLHLRIF